MEEMVKEALEAYDVSKKISDKVIKFANEEIYEKRNAFELAEIVEKSIKDFGGKPAWPVNISVNNVAAHYTPDINDTLVLREGDLVKLDIGVHFEGYIWDRAFTVCMGRKTHPLIEASEEALAKALDAVKSGVTVSKISEIIETTVLKRGFNPVRNLSGHALERYVQHAHPSIPNSRNNIQETLREGQAIAIEVFVTNGTGWVKESSPVMIYQYLQDRPVRMWEARKILEKSRNEFNKLPFAKRWIKDISPLKFDMAIKQLVEIEAIKEHPILKEQSNGLVAQTEETIIVK